MVSVSALLFQRQDDPIASGNDEERWGLVATSRPERLSMACHMEGTETSAPSWMCNTPRIMEILFSMPGSAIMSGRDIRVNILFAQTKAPEKYDPDSRRSYVYTTDRLYEIIDSVQSFDIDPEDILADIVQTSKITFTHTNPVATMVDIGGRTIAIVATLGFTIFWLSKMGFKGCRFACCDVCRRPDELFEIRRGKSTGTCLFPSLLINYLNIHFFFFFFALTDCSDVTHGIALVLVP